MLEYAYNPFQRKLEELDTTDLAILKTVAEGWYVEYKSQPLKKLEDIAKHISAFANQYGGFLFIGIGEAKNGSRCAETFPGVDVTDLGNISTQLREASSAHINPPVLYEEKVIKGPCPSIGLPENKAIIIIGIPKSTNTPHIHSSGRIYRRVADHSDPKPETDRHILDDLWNRGDRHRAKVTKFLSETPPLPKVVSDNSWAYIYLRPDENHTLPKKLLTFNEFQEVVTNSINSVQGIITPMDAVYSAPNGFAARQTKGNDPTLPSLSYRWWFDGTARLEIPLNRFTPAQFPQNKKYKHATRFLEISKQLKFEHASVVDYSYLLAVASGLTNIHLSICELLEDKRSIYSSFILKNIAFTSPYLDTENYLHRLEKNSLPLTTDNEIRQPNEPSQGNMFQLGFPSTDGECNPQSKPIVFIAPLISWLFHCVGATHELGEWSNDEEMWTFLTEN